MRQAIRNRSLSIIEPVSRLPVRILKFTEQRPGSENRLFGSKIGHDPGQRLGRLRVSDGHVKGSSTRGGHGAETGLELAEPGHVPTDWLAATQRASSDDSRQRR